jgi:hypothetical protein
MLEAGRSRDRIPTRWSFSIYLNLPAGLWPWSQTLGIVLYLYIEHTSINSYIQLCLPAHLSSIFYSFTYPYDQPSISSYKTFTENNTYAHISFKVFKLTLFAGVLIPYIHTYLRTKKIMYIYIYIYTRVYTVILLSNRSVRHTIHTST